MKRLFVEPLDVLMFRNERPFTARETHVAKIGVISPLTFEGAIKTKIFLEFCHRKGYLPFTFQRRKKGNETREEFEKSKEKLVRDVKEKLEKDTELSELFEVIGYTPLEYLSKLNVLGVFLAEKNEKEEYFPVPNDLVKEDKNGENVLKIKPILKDQMKISEIETYTCLSEYSKVKNIDRLIKFTDLIKYLHGENPTKPWINKKPYSLEIRTGIELERSTKKTVERAFYTAAFLRLLSGWGFIVWYESPNEIPNGIIKLGGEGKGAICEKAEEISLNEKVNFSELIKKINKNKEFKLYLATPSYFGECIPPKDELRGRLGVNELKLAAALPGKPVYIGGYDFALNKEKPLKKWVNVGAVYYYKFEGKIRENLEIPIKILNDNVNMRCGLMGVW